MVEQTRIIAVCSGKGGVGKSTVSLNLAYIIATKLNLPTLLIDANVTTSHLSFSLGVKENSVPTLNDILSKPLARGEIKIPNFFNGNFYFLPSSKRHEKLRDVELQRLRYLVQRLRAKQQFRYIIIDCAPGFGKEGKEGMLAGDEILLVAIPFISSLVDIYRITDFSLKRNKKILGIALNMVRNKKHELSVEDVEVFTQLDVLATLRYDEKVKKAEAMKRPVARVFPRSKFVKDVTVLASKITGEEISLKRSLKEKLRNILKISRHRP